MGQSEQATGVSAVGFMVCGKSRIKRGRPAPPDGGAGVDGHGIPETSQRRNGRADHRAEARPRSSSAGRPSIATSFSTPTASAAGMPRSIEKAEEYYLADLNSRNLTKVNNTKVIPGIDHRLSPGDRINICDVEFLFYPQLPADSPSKEPGDIMIVTEGENHDVSSPPHARRLALERHGEHGQARGQAQGDPRDRPQPFDRAQDRRGRAQDPRFAHGAVPAGRASLPGARRPRNQAARPQGLQVSARPRNRSSRPSSRPTRSP